MHMMKIRPKVNDIGLTNHIKYWSSISSHSLVSATIEFTDGPLFLINLNDTSSLLVSTLYFPKRG